MNPPIPIQTLHLFPEERAALLDLLSTLTPEEWDLPTVCEGWTVKDVALHILGGDLGNISRRRDDFSAPSSTSIADLVAFVNSFNYEWVQAARRLSPRLLIDLLAFSGPQLFAYFNTLDLDALGGPVSWAGPNPAPVWLDVAREYTERWLHQQHIRDAVNKPGLTDRRFLHPVLAAFVHALPHTFRDTPAPRNTTVHLHISGEAGGNWSLLGQKETWTLYEGAPDDPTAHLSLDQFTAWRLFTKGISPHQAEQTSTFSGDTQLARQVLHTISIIG